MFINLLLYILYGYNCKDLPVGAEKLVLNDKAVLRQEKDEVPRVARSLNIVSMVPTILVNVQ